MAKAKAVKYPIHKMGKQCGYEEFEDGSIRIAPAHRGVYDQYAAKREALDEFLASITRVSQGMSKEISQHGKKFWDGVREDYKDALGDGELIYEPTTGRVSRRLPPTTGEKQP